MRSRSTGLPRSQVEFAPLPNLERGSSEPGMPMPMLPFRDGKELKVGDTAASVATTLGRAAEVGRQDVDRGAYGERLTRFYEYSGARFILVFEPFERNGEVRVAGIYLP